MIAVVVPAHNEEEHLDACLQSLRLASRCARLKAEAVVLVVVLDACTDRTAQVAQSRHATTLSINARNVGIARAAGAQLALSAGARWLAFTDADSVVATNWLSAQLRQPSIAWSAAPRVVTSARRNFRAPEGFGATLQRIDLESGQGGEGAAA